VSTPEPTSEAPEEISDRPSKRRWVLPVLATLLGVALLAYLLEPHAADIRKATREASIATIAWLTLLSALALALRTEMWKVALRAAGHDLPRAHLHVANGGTFLVSLVNAYVGPAVKIWALRRMRSESDPKVGQLVVVDLASVALEIMVAALLVIFVFFAIDLAWWIPVVFVAGGVGLAVAAVLTHRRWEHHPAVQGLNVLMHGYYRWRLLALLVGVFVSQILRTWIALEAVGLDAGFGSATLIFVLTAVLGMLPTGLAAAPTAASVLVFGRDGVGAAAASGVLVTGSLFLATILYTLVTLAWYWRHRWREGAARRDSSSPHPVAGR
jgi:uncharacterized membrane protein YbhN (UPF0104 family)